MAKESTQARRDSIREAVRKHDAEKVDKITIRLPKGTRERISQKGYSVNAFVIEAVKEKLDTMDKGAEPRADGEGC